MFGDLGKMMKIAGRMKARMPEVQASLAAAQYTACAGGGAVQATVNGKLLVVEIKIDPAVAAELTGDVEMLADLVKSAVTAAQQQAVEAAATAMKELTGGLDIPGMDGLMP